jgi:phosphopantothenoylcysteine decarboxylase/phosphopantothenate--cysteine ligase
MLEGKEILLGVTGGIAAYKACELVRILIKQGAKVQVVMTEAATQFVSPLTFETLSQGPVYSGLFEKGVSPLVHIELADRAELLVIAPATADIIGKLANGIADDLLTTLYLATKAKVLVCPSMNVNMYEHPAFQENLAKLKKRGVVILEPGEGELACGWEGKGRLPEPEIILEACESMFLAKDLAGKKFLVTAGPTREAVDPVRYISNRSSGKMGYALAAAARARGAEVTLISGPVSIAAPAGVNLVKVESAEEMKKACDKYFKDADVTIKAAAVADFRPRAQTREKIKKQKVALSMELENTPDILADLGKKKRKGQILVGFAAETKDLVQNAKKKLQAKNLDLIVANDVSKRGAGFDVDTNIVTILFKDGKKKQLPQITKRELSGQLLDIIREILGQSG